MADFRPFSPCWGDISFTEAPELPPGATQGRYFFHAPPAWQTPEEPSAPRDAKPGRGARGRRRGLAGQRADAPSTHQRPGTTGVEGAGGSGGHGRASRSTTPREARVWRSRGRPGPTAPGTPAEPQATSSIANSGCGGRGRRRGLADTTQHRRRHRCGGCRRDRGAWLRRPWAVAGPGRASSRRAERSSQRGRLAGGPPPTGAQSSPAPQGAAQQAISGSQAPSGSPTLRQHPSARAGAPNRRQPARGPRPRR